MDIKAFQQLIVALVVLISLGLVVLVGVVKFMQAGNAAGKMYDDWMENQ